MGRDLAPENYLQLTTCGCTEAGQQCRGRQCMCNKAGLRSHLYVHVPIIWDQSITGAKTHTTILYMIQMMSEQMTFIWI